MKNDKNNGVLPGAVLCGTLTLAEGQSRHKIKLRDYAPQFRAVHQLLLDSSGIYGAAEEYAVEGDDVLVLPADITGTYTLWYRAYPEKISGETSDGTDLDVNEECAALVPIYMAAELYKDDDLSLATVLRNEYEDGLQKVRAAWQQGGSVYRSGEKKNMTGWW